MFNTHVNQVILPNYSINNRQISQCQGSGGEAVWCGRGSDGGQSGKGGDCHHISGGSTCSSGSPGGSWSSSKWEWVVQVDVVATPLTLVVGQ